MFPTIFVFPMGKKYEGMHEQYDGDRESTDIVRFALEKLAEMSPPPEVQEVDVANCVNCEEDGP